jgi:hypothetical protein
MDYGVSCCICAIIHFSSSTTTITLKPFNQVSYGRLDMKHNRKKEQNKEKRRRKKKEIKVLGHGSLIIICLEKF